MTQFQTDDRVRPLKLNFAERIQNRLKKMAAPGEEDVEPPSSIPKLVHQVFLDALEERATDVHIDPEKDFLCVRFRIDGILRDVALIPSRHAAQFMGHIKSLVDINPTPALKPVYGSTVYTIEDNEIYLRVTCAPTIQGEKISIRVLEPKRMRYSLEELGLNPDQKEMIDGWLENMNGMVLVSGATGSGKTTSLYALLHELKRLNRSVITIEDPVEYRIEGISQMQVNEARGITFSEAVRTMLRLDPDFLMVGEMRDRASAEAALAASATGKVLLSSLHSRDAAGTVTTLRNLGIHDYEIIAALELVISQRLIRRLCDKCRKQIETPSEDKRWLEAIGIDAPKESWTGVGCEYCRDTGYRGRIGLFEIWKVDEAANHSILKRSDEKSLRAALRKSGTPTLLEDGLAKAAEGITSIQELRRVSSYGFGITHH